MSSLVVDIYPAKSGDAFKIKFDNKKNIVIDMGYKETYKDFMKNDFIEMKKLGEIIDILIITHIDKDHIEGAIQFFNENEYSNNPKIIEVGEVWHNSYRHLQFSKQDKLISEDSEISILDGIRKSNFKCERKGRKENKEISQQQGSTLAAYLYKYNYKWNELFNNKAVCISSKKEVMLQNICIKLVSPTINKLSSLSRIWKLYLRGKKNNFRFTEDEIFDDAYEFYVKNLMNTDINEEKSVCCKGKNEFDIEKLKLICAKSADLSKSNGASIGIEIIYGKIKLLFLGDCHEDVIIESLESRKKDSEELMYTLIKIPHHGSLRNNSKWIDLAFAKYYIFSTDNKKHSDHPSVELISKIISRNKGQNEKIFLVFNYNISIINKIQNDKLKTLYNYEIIQINDNKKVSITI